MGQQVSRTMLGLMDGQSVGFLSCKEQKPSLTGLNVKGACANENCACIDYKDRKGSTIRPQGRREPSVPTVPTLSISISVSLFPTVHVTLSLLPSPLCASASSTSCLYPCFFCILTLLQLLWPLSSSPLFSTTTGQLSCFQTL